MDGGFGRLSTRATRCEGAHALRYRLTPLHHTPTPDAENGAFRQPDERADDGAPGSKKELLRWALATFAQPRGGAKGADGVRQKLLRNGIIMGPNSQEKHIYTAAQAQCKFMADTIPPG